MYSVEFIYKGHEKDFIMYQNLNYIKNQNKIAYFYNRN